MVWVVQMWSEFSPCSSWPKISMNKVSSERGKIKEDELKRFNCRHLFIRTFLLKKKNPSVEIILTQGCVLTALSANCCMCT